jgi:hypothetical protein
MEVLQSQINPASATFKSNMAHNLEQVRLLQSGSSTSGRAAELVPWRYTASAASCWPVSASIRFSIRCPVPGTCSAGVYDMTDNAAPPSALSPALAWCTAVRS